MPDGKELPLLGPPIADESLTWACGFSKLPWGSGGGTDAAAVWSRRVRTRERYTVIRRIV